MKSEKKTTGSGPVRSRRKGPVKPSQDNANAEKVAGKRGKSKKGPTPSDKKKEKKRPRGFLALENRGIIERINTFVRYNSLVITVGVLFTFFFLNSKLSSLSETVEETLVKNTQFIKQNIGHPIFLSATGQVVVAEKSPMGFYDPRFQSYIANNFTQAFIGGAVKYSDNGKMVPRNGEDIYQKSKWIQDFAQRFLDEKNGYSVLKSFVDGIYFNILDGKFPEYIEPIKMKIKSFHVSDLDKDRQTGKFEIVIAYKVIVKSWIADLKKWDTRVVDMTLTGRGVLDPFSFGDIGNPFGIRITYVDIPVLVKPSARSLLLKDKV